MAENKTKTTNVVSERCVLSGLCKYGSEVYYENAHILDVDCFSESINEIVFTVLSKMINDGEKIDYPSVVSKTLSIGMIDFFKDKTNEQHVKSLFNLNINRESVQQHAKIIKKLSIVRKAQNVIKDTWVSLNDLTGSESIDDIMSTFESPLSNFIASLTTEEGQDVEDITQGLAEWVEQIGIEQPQVVGIPSPWPIYNEVIGNGRRAGGVYIVGARPKNGKSTFAINDALHTTSLGIPTLYIDTEMTKSSVWPRVIASVAEIPMSRIETGQFANSQYEKAKVISAVEFLEKNHFQYLKCAGSSFDSIMSKVRKWVMQKVPVVNGVRSPCLVIYDYFKLMDASDLKSMQEYQAVGFQIQKLTDFCNNYKIACSAYVQLNRTGLDKDDGSIISQSDRLLWLCSSFAFIRRKTPEEIQQEGPHNGNTKLIVTEDQRYGPGLEQGDYINIAFHRDRAKIIELGLKSKAKTVTDDSGFDIKDSYDESESDRVDGDDTD